MGKGCSQGQSRHDPLKILCLNYYSVFFLGGGDMHCREQLLVTFDAMLLVEQTKMHALVQDAPIVPKRSPHRVIRGSWPGRVVVVVAVVIAVLQSVIV